MTDHLLDDVTTILRKHYTLCRARAQRVKTFRPGEKWDKYFKRAAWHCIEHRISPYEYIEVQFHALKPYPEITQLGSERALKRYRESRHDYAGYIDEMAQIQSIGFEKLMSAGVDPQAALLNPINHFDPLFVYIAAKQGGFEDIMNRSRDIARVQYMTSVHYDAVYGDLIPEEIKKPVEEDDD